MRLYLKDCLIGFVIACVCIAVVALADRTDVWNAASAKVDRVSIYPVVDGGCAVMAFAHYFKGDGGREDTATDIKEVSGVNQTACLDILAKGRVLFLNDKGL